MAAGKAGTAPGRNGDQSPSPHAEGRSPDSRPAGSPAHGGPVVGPTDLAVPRGAPLRAHPYPSVLGAQTPLGPSPLWSSSHPSSWVCSQPARPSGYYSIDVFLKTNAFLLKRKSEKREEGKETSKWSHSLPGRQSKTCYDFDLSRQPENSGSALGRGSAPCKYIAGPETIPPSLSLPPLCSTLLPVKPSLWDSSLRPPPSLLDACRPLHELLNQVNSIFKCTPFGFVLRFFKLKITGGRPRLFFVFK